MAGRASIVGAAETSIGKVRDHNEDSHFIDPELGIFLVCDGMGGHAAGEVASALAVSVIREAWGSDAMQDVAERWLARGTPDARKQLMTAITNGVTAAHDAILGEAEVDREKAGMGTTLVGAMVVGGDIVFAHAGDSRAYLVRDGIAMQLTEDHTLLARLLAAGVDVDTEGEGSRFKSMLTNALGIGTECKVSTFVVPVADGDRFLLCSDGITEYVKEAEIGTVLTKQPSPARSAQRLVELALDRGGGDNATALVVRVLEAGETSRPAELLRKEQEAIHSCPLWAKVNPQQRLRALRIALPRDHALGDKLPAHTLGDRVAWILVEGSVLESGLVRGPGSLVYPESLLADRPLPDKDGLAVAQGEVRALALRSDDFRELCDEDPELAEALLDALGSEIATRRPHRRTGKIPVHGQADGRAATPPVGSPFSTASVSPTATTPPAGLPAVEVDEPTPPKPLTAIPSVLARPAAHDEPAQRRTPTVPPGGGATLPKVPSGTHPRVASPVRRPTPPIGVPARKPTPASGVPAKADPAAKAEPSSVIVPTLPTRLTPPTGVRRPTPPLGIPGLPKKLTPATGVRTPTPPLGVPAVREPQPVGPPPLFTASTPADPTTPRAAPRGSAPPNRLIVPPTEREAADAAVDTEFRNITVDDTWGDVDPHVRPIAPPLSSADDGDSEPGEVREIIVDADEPLEPRPPEIVRPRALDQSEPEISIEALADEDSGGNVVREMVADSPSQSIEQVDDASQPEIEIIQHGRAITANDAATVSGTIDESRPKRRS